MAVDNTATDDESLILQTQIARTWGLRNNVGHGKHLLGHDEEALAQFENLYRAAGNAARADDYAAELAASKS